MVERVRELISSQELRAQMGAAGRREAASWGWGASTSELRNVQYNLAEERYSLRHRWLRRYMTAKFAPIKCWLASCSSCLRSLRKKADTRAQDQRGTGTA